MPILKLDCELNKTGCCQFCSVLQARHPQAVACKLPPVSRYPQSSHLQAVTCKLQAVTRKLSPTSRHLQAVPCKLSPESCHPPVIAYKLSPASCHLQAVTRQLSPASFRRQVITCKLLFSTFSALKMSRVLIMKQSVFVSENLIGCGLFGLLQPTIPPTRPPLLNPAFAAFNNHGRGGTGEGGGGVNSQRLRLTTTGTMTRTTARQKRNLM